MTPTRERILAYLHHHRAATVNELSQALKLTPANIRHHLAVLSRYRQVEIIGKRAPSQRGRPGQVFALAQKEYLLEPLAESLLGTLLAETKPPQRASRLKALALNLQGRRPPHHHKSLAKNLLSAIQRLNELGYSARWEARPEHPTLILGRCPYAGIIDRHPELCHMDAHLLEAMIQRPVRQTAKLEPTPLGMPICMFILLEVGARESNGSTVEPDDHSGTSSRQAGV